MLTRGRVPVPFSLRGGSIAALPTPFSDGIIDEQAVARLCDRQIAAGTSAIVVCATTGEGPALSDAEYGRVVQLAVAASDDRIPVIAGAGTAGTEHTIALARLAERAGAAALLCVTPYYVRPTQEGIIAHMRRVHDAVRIPLILYDVPARTACALADETVARLAKLERIVGLKDATGDIGRVARLRETVKREFLLLSGDDETQARHRAAGGDGCISVTANVAPGLCARLHEAWDGGNLQEFNRIAAVLAPLNRALFLETNPIPVKHALSHLGLIAEESRLPLMDLAREHHAAVESAVDRVLAEENRTGPREGLRPVQLSAADIWSMGTRAWRA